MKKFAYLRFIFILFKSSLFFFNKPKPATSFANVKTIRPLSFPDPLQSGQNINLYFSGLKVLSISIFFYLFQFHFVSSDPFSDSLRSHCQQSIQGMHLYPKKVLGGTVEFFVDHSVTVTSLFSFLSFLLLNLDIHLF